MGEFVGKRVVPDHVGLWSQDKVYEPLMIVLNGATGDSYISRRAVPVGISLSDESYWSLCAHYPAKLTTGYYRVRQTWEDEASQLGAYKLLTNAKTKCDENQGYFVFTNDGTAIYPENATIQENASIQENETEQEEVIGQKDTPDADTPGVEETVETVSAEDTSSAGTVSEEGPTEEGHTQEANTEGDFPDAVEYENDGGEQVIAYARLKTLMNIRTGNALDAELITTYRKNTIVEVLQECGNGWLRIKCPESRNGYAYVEEYQRKNVRPGNERGCAAVCGGCLSVLEVLSG